MSSNPVRRVSNDGLVERKVPSPEQVVADIHPNDGLAVHRVAGHDGHMRLEVVVRCGIDNTIVERDNPIGDGEIMAVCPIKPDIPNAEFMNHQILGSVDRAELLVAAICRFVNTGGNIRKVNDFVYDIEKFMIGMKSESILPQGYGLCASCINTEGNYEHLIRCAEFPAGVLLVENQFADTVNVQAYLDTSPQTYEWNEVREPTHVHEDDF